MRKLWLPESARVYHGGKGRCNQRPLILQFPINLKQLPLSALYKVLPFALYKLHSRGSYEQVVDTIQILAVEKAYFDSTPSLF